ncbi:MAG: 16S rRNA (uracil(1498)-N(3))-methyltransferase [Bacteroidia bacterium]
MIQLPDLSCFYDPQCIGVNNTYSLPDHESHHALKVLRLKIDDEFLVSNGVGGIYLCRTIEVSRRDLIYLVIAKKVELKESMFKNTLACGVLGSQSRMEWMVEKLTEIGINEIIFYHNKRSKRKNINLSRLNKATISALKQSRKAFLPKISEVEFEQLLELKYACKLVAICDENDYGHIVKHKEANNLILIGPEGDFSSDEINLLLRNDFKPCALGSERLRSETAALYALTCLNINSTP